MALTARQAVDSGLPTEEVTALALVEIAEALRRLQDGTIPDWTERLTEDEARPWVWEP